jgi:hypothetical protein
VNPLPGRSALEAELEATREEPEKPAPPDPQIVAWDRRVAPRAEPEAPPPTLKDRLRALFARR